MKCRRVLVVAGGFVVGCLMTAAGILAALLYIGKSFIQNSEVR